MLSIIIPTLNEEKHLSRLLDSIKRQSFEDYEIIVADADSTDNTQDIAVRFGSQIVPGGLPAVGRNAGARIARGEFLIFLDADVVLPDNFLQNAYTEMQERYLDLATCEIIPISDIEIDKIMHGFTNLYIQISQYTNPHAPGFCILVTKRLYDRIGGFNEKLTMAEDHEFVKRASQFRPLRVLNSTSIHVSVRRLEKEGRYTLATKYIQVELYRMFVGEPKKTIIDYEFDNFGNDADEKLIEWTQRTKDKVNKLKENIVSFSWKKNLSEENYKNALNRLISSFDKIKESFPKFLIPR